MVSLRGKRFVTGGRYLEEEHAEGVDVARDAFDGRVEADELWSHETQPSRGRRVRTCMRGCMGVDARAAFSHSGRHA